MTDQMKPTIDGVDDLELLSDWLNGHLDPERAELVRSRLEKDAEFREFAAPLLMIWSIPRQRDRVPRPEGEAERAWERFSRRVRAEAVEATVVVEPPKPKRRRWPRWLAAFVLLIATIVLLPATSYRPMKYSPVPYAEGWIPLNDGVEVQLEPGTALSISHRRQDRDRLLKLDGGTARFRIVPFDTITSSLRERAILIHTSAGQVTAGEAEFTVTVRGDTTWVYNHPRTPRPSVRFWNTTVRAAHEKGPGLYELPVAEGEGARIIVGHDTERLFPIR